VVELAYIIGWGIRHHRGNVDGCRGRCSCGAWEKRDCLYDMNVPSIKPAFSLLPLLRRRLVDAAYLVCFHCTPDAERTKTLPPSAGFCLVEEHKRTRACCRTRLKHCSLPTMTYAAFTLATSARALQRERCASLPDAAP